MTTTDSSGAVRCGRCDANQRYVSDEAKQQGWAGSKYCAPCLRKMFPEAPLMDGEKAMKR